MSNNWGATFLIHSAVHILFKAIAAILFAVFLLSAFLAWRLSQGPLNLNFLTDYFESTAIKSTEAFDFRIEAIHLVWSNSKSHPTLHASNVKVVNGTGEVVALLPNVAVGVSMPALFQGKLAADEITLRDPQIRITRLSDSGFFLGLNTNKAQPDSQEDLDQARDFPLQSYFSGYSPPEEVSNAVLSLILDALVAPLGPENPGGYLNKIYISGTTALFIDVLEDATWIIPETNLILSRDQNGVQFDASLPMTNDGEVIDFHATGKFFLSTGVIDLQLLFKNLNPASVAEFVPELQALRKVSLDFDGKIHFNMNVVQSAVLINWVKFSMEGKEGNLSISTGPSTDYVIDYMELDGRADRELDTIVVEKLNVHLKDGESIGPRISLRGIGTAMTTTPNIQLNIQIDSTSLEQLKRYWPEDVKPRTRNWIRANLFDGRVYDTEFKLVLDGASMETTKLTSIQMTAGLSGVTVNYIKGMPKIRDVFGIISLNEDVVVIDVGGGTIPDPLTSKGVNIESAHLRMYGLITKNPRADFNLRIIGSLGEALRVIESEPFLYASAVGIDPFEVSGETQILLSLEFPLIPELGLDQINIGVKASLSDVDVPGVVLGQALTDGQLSLSLDKMGMNINGTGALGGVRTGLTWRENFTDDSFRSQFALDAVIENEQRGLFGLGFELFTPPYIDGEALTQLIYTVNRDNTATLETEADLTNTKMSVPEVGWSKKKGQSARLTASIRFLENNLKEISYFRMFAADDLDISGSAHFREGGEIERLNLADVVIGQTRLKADLHVDSLGRQTWLLKGPVFDARNAWNALRSDDDDSQIQARDTNQGTSIRARTIEASFDEVRASRNGRITNANFHYSSDVSSIQELQLSGLIDGQTEFYLHLSPDEDKLRFSARGEDGGGVLRVLGLYDDLVGGQLAISGELLHDGGIKGTATIEEFKVVNAPLLARILSVASLTGIVDELQGDGISFSLLNLPFDYGDSRLRVSDVEMYGSALGLTANGIYDFADIYIDGGGTVIPAYALNSMLGNLPLVGGIFSGGEKGGGVFAATYSVQGNVEGAEVTVNPLSALTPGFLRNIFSVLSRQSPRLSEGANEQEPK